MATEAREFVVADARRLRRQLGLTAWAVLEELVAHSHEPIECCLADASVRGLATDLGLSKDTIARALRRLGNVGIAVAEQRRTAAGTFATGTYRIAIPDCLVLIDRTDPVPTPTLIRSATRQTGSQLALGLDT